MPNDPTREEVLQELDDSVKYLKSVAGHELFDKPARNYAAAARMIRESVPREVALRACAYSSMICSRSFAFNDERPAEQSLDSALKAMRERGETIQDIVTDPIIGEDFVVALAAAEKEAKKP